VAEETIDIALEVGKQLVGIDSSSAVPLKIVGIDYCGDCYKGTFSDFIPALKRAKENGLQLSIHCGEKDDNEEIRQMLSVGPSRLGHLCFISSELQEVVQQSRIPAEFCITSNILTSNLGHASDHHLLNWFCHNETTPKDLHSVFPFSINTDDRGVFYTSMTKELCLFAEAILPGLIKSSAPSVSSEDLVHSLQQAVLLVQRDSLAHTFLSKSEITALEQGFDAELQRRSK
jgi:adenosine deaminase